MAENTFKKKKQSLKLFQYFNRAFNWNIEPIVENAVPTSYIPKMLFLAVLGIIYIANAHLGERMVRQTTKLENEVENIRADYTTHKADYDAFAGKKAEIAKRADSLGLEEGKGKIQKIIVKKGEY
jgi:hypothetical protein